jgi:hypothetical protein
MGVRGRCAPKCHHPWRRPRNCPLAPGLPENTFAYEICGLTAPFSDRHWHLLMLAMRCPGASDLMHSCPALAFALASSWVFKGERRVRQPLRAARTLLKKRQRAIADWLQFPATESAVRILRRVPHSAIKIGPLLYLRGAMHDEAALRILCHVPTVTVDVIRVMSSPELLRHSSPRLLIEAGSEPEPDVMLVWRTMRDTLAMFQQLGREPDGLRFRSREHLVMVHDELAATLNRRRCDRRDDQLRIPPPPLTGTEAIIPLTTMTDFYEEGREQGNCVVSYASRVSASAGDAQHEQAGLYVYRVLWPERATLSISRRGKKWFIDELQCAGNRPPSPTTLMAVQEWLETGKFTTTWSNDCSAAIPAWSVSLTADPEEEESLVPL